MSLTVLLHLGVWMGPGNISVGEECNISNHSSRDPTEICQWGYLGNRLPVYPFILLDVERHWELKVLPQNTKQLSTLVPSWNCTARSGVWHANHNVTTFPTLGEWGFARFLVFSLQTKEQDLLLPAHKAEAGEEFTGATVIEPSKGWEKTTSISYVRAIWHVIRISGENGDVYVKCNVVDPTFI